MSNPGPDFPDKPRPFEDALAKVSALAEAGKLPTLELILPGILSMQGKPFTLDEHFHFATLFRMWRPQKMVLCTGRQLGKSTSLAADGVTLSAIIPYFSTLYITPFFEQIQRFSTLSVQPFIFESPIRHLLIGSNTVQRVLQRVFKNGSRMMFSFATTDAGRTRGLSVKRCSFDEVDDIDHDVLPVILETMSADKKYMLEQYAGTPKATDGTLPRLLSRSSHAEWFIPCQHCTTGGKPTWNIPSTEYHLDKMVENGIPRIEQGDISLKKPGLCCYKCANPVYPWLGHWEHRRPAERLNFAGYHIPQPITPLHYGYTKKWAAIIGKRNRYTPAKLWNEVYGEAKDEGQKLVSQTELQKVAVLPWKNNPDNPDPALMGRLGDYILKVLAIDWGGGGEDGLSTTALSVLGLLPNGQIHVLWGKRMLGVAHVAEARRCLWAFQHFKCDYIIHDYGGGGVQRETFLRHAGVPADRIRPVAYAPLASQDLVVHKEPTEHHRRAYWQMDKTRSLQMSVASIQLERTLFFQWDRMSDDEPGLIADFLRLVEHRSKIESMAGPMYRIRGDGKGPDDFAQSVNIGTIGLWELSQVYPNFALDAKMEVDAATISRIIGDDTSWALHGDVPLTDAERRAFGLSAYEEY